MRTVAGVVAVWVLGAIPLGSLVGRLLRAAAAGTVDAAAAELGASRTGDRPGAAAAAGGRGTRSAS